MSYRLFLIVALLVAVCGISAVNAAWPPLNWDIKYDADLLPDSSDVAPSPIQAWDGNAYIDASNFALAYDVTSKSVSGGILSASTIDRNDAGFWQKSLTSLPAGVAPPDSSTGYTVEFKLKVTDIDEADTWFAIFTMEEGIPDVARYWNLQVYKSSAGGGLAVRLTGDSVGNYTYVESDDTDRQFHTYRITADDSGVTLYVDGSTAPVNSTPVPYRALDQDKFAFGDFTGSTDASYELDYIGIYSGGAIAGVSDAIVYPAGWGWRKLTDTISYIGDLEPDVSGAIRYDGTPWAGCAKGYTFTTELLPPGSGEVVGQVFHQNTMDGGSGAGYYSLNPANIPEQFKPNSVTGYTVEVRAKVNDTSDFYGYWQFRFDEDTIVGEDYIDRYWALVLTKDTNEGSSSFGEYYAGLSTEGTDWTKVSEGWHTYRITVTDDGIARLYIDGSNTPALEKGTYAGSTGYIDLFQFGDTTSETSDVDLDYFIFDCTGAAVSCNSTFLDGDVNQDCYVNSADVVDFAGKWLNDSGLDWDYPWDADSDPTNTGWYSRSIYPIAEESIVPIDDTNNAYEINMPDVDSRIWWQTVDYDPAGGSDGAWDPHASDNTIEFRMKIVSDEGYRGTDHINYYVFAALACDADLVPDEWNVRGFFFNYDSIVEMSDGGCNNCANYVMFDCSEWHTYRLDYDGAGTATLSYWDGAEWQQLLTSSVGRYWANLPRPQYGSYYRLGNAEGWGGWGVVDVDYVYHNGPGCAVEVPGDLTGDCTVNFDDFTVIAQDWLDCNSLDDPACTP